MSVGLHFTALVTVLTTGGPRCHTEPLRIDVLLVQSKEVIETGCVPPPPRSSEVDALHH